MSEKDVVTDVLASVCVMLNEAEPVLELVYMVEDDGRVIELKRDDREICYESNLRKLLKENNNLIDGLENFSAGGHALGDDSVADRVEDYHHQINNVIQDSTLFPNNISLSGDSSDSIRVADDHLGPKCATSRQFSGLCDIAESLVHDASQDERANVPPPDHHFRYEALRMDSQDGGQMHVSHSMLSESDIEAAIEERVLSRVEEAIEKRMDEIAEKIVQKLRNGE